MSVKSVLPLARDNFASAIQRKAREEKEFNEAAVRDMGRMFAYIESLEEVARLAESSLVVSPFPSLQSALESMARAREECES
jgi:hypothetical protein